MTKWVEKGASFFQEALVEKGVMGFHGGGNLEKYWW